MIDDDLSGIALPGASAIRTLLEGDELRRINRPEFVFVGTHCFPDFSNHMRCVVIVANKSKERAIHYPLNSLYDLILVEYEFFG